MHAKPRWIVLFLLFVAVAACAHPGGAPSSPFGRSAAPSPSPSWMSGVGVIGVAGITVGADGRTLSITVEVPAAVDGTSCYRNVSTRINDFSTASTIIGVYMDVWSGRPCSKSATTTVNVRLPKPLGSRTVNVDSSSEGFYVADPKSPGTLRFCYEGQCAPPPATCQDTAIATIARGADMQQLVTWIVRSCDKHWLVLDISFTGGPACDGACSSPPKTTLRWFYRATPHGWTEVTATRSAGCAAIQAVDASFPTAACENLGPL